VSTLNLLDEKIYGNALNLIPALGPVNLTKLLNYCGGFLKAWNADGQDYFNAGISPKTVDKIITDKQKINPEQSFAETTRRQIEILLISEKSYPQLLKEIIPAPPLLYVRGNKKVLNSLTVAVVGTRKISSYGTMACEEITLGLTNSGMTIVSGLAYGADAVALQTVVDNRGKGIAVLASDLNDTSIAPRSNFNLAQKILEKGCLVSEYPLGYSVQKQNFPIRNRIISGLSLGTLVVEADIESGALITANYSLEQNREVFAIPGSIFSPTSRGTNQLIKSGAKVVTSANDILEELNLDTEIVEAQTNNIEITEIESKILELLSKIPIHIDEIIKSAQVNPAIISANLTLLEIKGRIKNLGGAKYVKIR